MEQVVSFFTSVAAIDGAGPEFPVDLFRVFMVLGASETRSAVADDVLFSKHLHTLFKPGAAMLRQKNWLPGGTRIRLAGRLIPGGLDESSCWSGVVSDSFVVKSLVTR